MNRFLTAEMHVGGFPPHEIQETIFVSFLRQVVNWNPVAVRGKAAPDPRSPHMNQWIVAANRLVDYGLIEDRIGTGSTRAQTQADGASALASRATLPPCQSAKATTL